MCYCESASAVMDLIKLPQNINHGEKVEMKIEMAK